METNFWDNGIELISLVKDIWEEPTPLKLETLRIKMNEEIKKQLQQNYEEAIIVRVQYTREKLRFTAGKDSYKDFIKTSLYRIFPQRLISWSHDGPELLKYPETWISSSEVNK
jgi:hypothetical protein